MMQCPLLSQPQMRPFRANQTPCDHGCRMGPRQGQQKQSPARTAGSQHTVFRPLNFGLVCYSAKANLTEVSNVWHQRPTLLPLGRPAQGVQGSVAPGAGAQDLGLAWAAEPVRDGQALSWHSAWGEPCLGQEATAAKMGRPHMLPVTRSRNQVKGSPSEGRLYL